MILNTPQIQRRPEKKRLRTSGKRSRAAALFTILKVMTLLFFAFLVGTGIVICRSEIEKLNRRAVALEANINVLNREVANLQIRREQYMGRHILQQVKHFELKLKLPVAGQVRSVRLNRPQQEVCEVRKTGEVLVSRR